VAGQRIKNIIETQFTEKGAKKVAQSTGQVGRAQTRLGQASASAGRAFAAQANGLGGLVSAYAGAAATVFAITAAFQALNQAAQTAQVVEGLNALATTVGTTGSEILKRSQEVTRGLVSIRETAESVNIGLSAGFNQDQILELQKVSLGASRALGRTLTDALTRVTRGAAKLEPELLDELGIFVKIDPAVESYAAKLNKTATSLTDFERRQAFVNAIIDQGTAKFSIIDTTSGNALESLQRLATVIVDLGAKVGGALANSITPFADYISGDLGNTLAVFGILARTVFGSALGVAIGGIKSATESAQGLANALGERALGGNAEKQGIAFGKLALATEKLDLRYVTGSRSAAKYTKELIRQAREGTLAVQDLARLESRLIKLRDETEKGTLSFRKYKAALKQVQAAQAATGKTSLLLANGLGRASKIFGLVGVGIASVLRGITSFITAISVARLVLKPFTDALGITDEIDDFVKTMFNLSLRLFGVDEASKAAKKGFDGLASSLLSANEIFQSLPDKILVTKNALFGLTTLTKELTKQDLAKEFSDLLENLDDPDAIDDFRDKFKGLTFEAKQALEAIVTEALRFQEVFPRSSKLVSASLGEVNRQTGVAVKSLADYLFVQEEIARQGLGTAFQGAAAIDGGNVVQFNLALAETGKILSFQVADTERINDLIKEGNLAEVERLTIGAGILGFLSQEAKFRADLEEGNLNAEQLKKTESALQATLNNLLERAKKLGDEILETQIRNVAASQNRLTAETEIQTQQDLFNKRIRKDFSAQLAQAGKLNGLASVKLQLATSQSEINRNQLDQISAILKADKNTTKEKTLQETVSKVAAGLVSKQLQDIRKIREEEEKRLNTLRKQLTVLEKQSTVKDSQRDLKALQEQNSIAQKQASSAEQLRKAEVDLNKIKRQETIKALEDQADLQKSLLDKRSGLFSEQQLQQLKIEIDEKTLAALRAETAKQITERRNDLAKEIELIDDKAKADIIALNLQRDIAEQQAALELEKIKQDGIKFDLEQKLRDQRVKELEAQSNIFKDFINDFARLLAGLSADIRIATDPKIKKQIEGGASIGNIREGLVDLGMEKVTPQLSKGLDTSMLKKQQNDIKAAFDKITDLRIAEIAKEERATEESIDRRIDAVIEQADAESKIKALVAEKDILSLLSTVSARERVIAKAKEMNASLSTMEVLQISVASNLRQGLTGAFENLNQQLIEGTLTMDSIGNTFRDMLGGMMKAIQQEVFATTIAKPIATGISGFIGSLFAGGGPVHMAGGGVMRRDRVHAMLEPGEFVMRKEAVKRIGMDQLQMMNAAIPGGKTEMIKGQPHMQAYITPGEASILKKLGGSGETYKGLPAFADTGGDVDSVGHGMNEGQTTGNPGGGTSNTGGPGPNNPGFGQLGANVSSSAPGGSHATASSGAVTAGQVQAAMDRARATGRTVGIVDNLDTKSDREERAAQMSREQHDYAQEVAERAAAKGFKDRNTKVGKGLLSLAINTAVANPLGKAGQFAVGALGLFGNDPGSKATGQKGAMADVGPSIAGFIGGMFGGNPDDPSSDEEMASGGIVRMAQGGRVNQMRDRVPALLEPGEFVIRKPMAKAIGGKALGAMNATGSVSPGNVSVNINNQGSPKGATVSAPRMNGDKMIIDVITRDLRNNGSIRKSLRGGNY